MGFSCVQGFGGEATGSAFQIAAIGNGKCVGGVIVGKQFFFVQFHQSHQHSFHLFFGGKSVSRHGLFDFQRCKFKDGNVSHHGCGDDHPLCSAEFEHALHVLSAEGCFHRNFVGVKSLHETCHSFQDSAQLEIDVLALSQVDYSHGKHLAFLSAHPHGGIAQHARAGVYSENHFFGSLSHRSSILFSG